MKIVAATKANRLALPIFNQSFFFRSSLFDGSAADAHSLANFTSTWNETKVRLGCFSLRSIVALRELFPPLLRAYSAFDRETHFLASNRDRDIDAERNADRKWCCRCPTNQTNAKRFLKWFCYILLIVQIGHNLIGIELGVFGQQIIVDRPFATIAR